jgi:hypothetical protein
VLTARYALDGKIAAVTGAISSAAGTEDDSPGVRPCSERLGDLPRVARRSSTRAAATARAARRGEPAGVVSALEPAFQSPAAWERRVELDVDAGRDVARISGGAIAV